jgi:hypothetical protein
MHIVVVDSLTTKSGHSTTFFNVVDRYLFFSVDAGGATPMVAEVIPRRGATTAIGLNPLHQRECHAATVLEWEYVEMIKCLTIKTLRFCRLSTEV